jgi:hypothetical protein
MQKEGRKSTQVIRSNSYHFLSLSSFFPSFSPSPFFTEEEEEEEDRDSTSLTQTTLSIRIPNPPSTAPAKAGSLEVMWPGRKGVSLREPEVESVLGTEGEERGGEEDVLKYAAECEIPTWDSCTEP